MKKAKLIILNGNPEINKQFQHLHTKLVTNCINATKSALSHFGYQLTSVSTLDLALEKHKMLFKAFIRKILNSYDLVIVISHSRGTCFQPNITNRKLVRMCLGITFCSYSNCDIILKNSNELVSKKVTRRHYDFSKSRIQKALESFLSNRLRGST